METICRMFPVFLLISFLTFTSGKDLLSCLSSGGVSNVKTYSSPSYPELLNSTIGNLIFTRLHAPKPFALVFPITTDQISTSIRCCREASLAIRVRSGGHSHEGFSATAEKPFVIIDMANFDKVTVDLDTETAWVESGATIGKLYYTVGREAKNYAVSAGFWPTVGIGGHFIGGGFGPIVRKYGLAADNILDAILIDAEGRVLDRKEMGEEVFWAIRGGGGGSWGVVVAWKIQLLPMPEKVTALRLGRVGTTSQAAEIWHKWQMVAPKLDDEFFLSLVASPRQDTVGIAMGIMGLYLGSKASALSIISKRFPEMNLTSDECQEMSWVESAVYLLGANKVEDLKNRTFYPKTYFLEKYDHAEVPIPLTVLEDALLMVAKQPKSAMRANPHGGYFSRIRSGAVPYPHRSNLYEIQYTMNWEEADDENSDEYISWTRKIYEYMEAHVSKNPRSVYVNVLDLDLGSIDWTKPGLTGPAAVELARSWGEKYFVNNYDRLVRAKTLIDPNNVFNNPQSIPPSLSLLGYEVLKRALLA